MARSLRRHFLAALSLAILLGGLVAAYFAAQASTGTIRATPRADTVQKGPVPGTFGNHWTSLPDPPVPTTGPPNTCGMWSAQNSPQAEAIQSMHGIIQSCMLIGDDWVVTTEGGPGSQLGVFDCSPTDTTCLNGWHTKNLTAFTWQTPPPAVTFLKIVWVQGDTLTLLSNDGEWTYNVSTGTWARFQCSCGEAP